MKQYRRYAYLLTGSLMVGCSSKAPVINDTGTAQRIEVGDDEDDESSRSGDGTGKPGEVEGPGEPERQPSITGDANSRVLDAPCTEGSSGPQVIDVDHAGSASDSFEVKTEWCLKGKQVGRLRVMFLVDHSGSMNNNDPLVNGSCGRLDAANALVEKIKSQMAESDEVDVAAVTFGTQAKPAASFVPIDDFASSHINAEVFCGALDQTNYQSALQVAIDLVRGSADSETPVVAYLLSDGLPSLGSEQSQEDYISTEQAALSAAKSFRELGNVSLNAIYLQSTRPAGTTSPESYLAELTGGPDKVKIVSNAQELAASVTKFELPAPKTDLTSATATVTGKGKPRSVTLKSVEPDPTNPNKILVTTERFKLTEADEEETTRYFIKLKVDIDDGTIQQTTIVINIKS
jgi:uncharacterized protein YegL